MPSDAAGDDGGIEQVKCERCGYTTGYTLTNDGRIPDPCPDCGSDSLEVSDGE